MSDLRVDYLAEPLLRFRHAQTNDDPRSGLFLYGPLVTENQPNAMRVGVVGTAEGCGTYRQWVSRIQQYIPAADRDAKHQIGFPGFEAAFKTKWPERPVTEIRIPADTIATAIRIADRHVAIHKTVSIFADAINRRLREEAVSVDVWFVVIPDDVYVYGRPLSRVPASEQTEIRRAMTARVARRFLHAPSLFDEDMQQVEAYRYGVDFHNQLKARLLPSNVVVQVVRESSIAQSVDSTGVRLRRLQDPATLAWNLCTTSFYKATGRPWQLATIRPDVCYIGLVFKKINQMLGNRNACCGAQMFLSTGDGMVFKGALGPWFSPSSKEFHLSSSAARDLMEQTLQAYFAEHQRLPAELFIHGQTYFDDEEWSGFQEAVPNSTRLVGVRIRRSREVKLFRSAEHPVLRGTLLRIHPRKALLWTSGFVPALGTYPGRETPNPLSVEITRGDADLDSVANDIMSLTKLNFNACIYADGLPVTLRFANSVGEILMAGDTDSPVPPLPFRNYI